jgi:hypothetical protein
MEINVDKIQAIKISKGPSQLLIMINQNLDNVQYFNYLGSIITNYSDE